MERFSVKKPFTVLVAVIMVLVLGFISVTRMTTDLLPSISLPYMIVITTYPGASPEKVEAAVTEPMESALGTVSGVKNVYSVSAENYSMVQLEFEDDTDMDSAMVKVSSSIQKVSAQLPEICGTPSIMELSMDMMATMYVGVAREGYDIYELSEYVADEVAPYIERQSGVASVSSVGLVEQTVQVDLNQSLIDDVNDRILAATNDALADAKAELDKAGRQVAKGQAELDKQKSAFGSTLSGMLFGQIDGAVLSAAAEMKGQVDAAIARLEELQAQIEDSETLQLVGEVIADLRSLSSLLGDLAAGQLPTEEQLAQAKATIEHLRGLLAQLGGQTGGEPEQTPDPTPGGEAPEAADPTPGDETPEAPARTPGLGEVLQQIPDMLEGLSGLLGQVPAILAGMETAVAGLTQAQLEAAVAFSTAQTQLSLAQSQLESARAQYETAREQALQSANLSQLLSASTLSGLIYAQNFSMPAGYIDDENDDSWLLKVGEEFTSADQIGDMLLCSIDGVGDIRLSDVADVTVIDNADDSYAKLNGEDAVVLCIFKSSTAGTNEVSNQCREAFAALEEDVPGLSVLTLMDQGVYITMIVKSVLSSMLLGAALAILVLALFLKDVKPTLVVAISIPLSVLFAIVLMYFTGLTLNMMTLSGLALGIGMLVDNSIVVMENIYRLRSRGISAPRAAVQGARQVTGAIVASTLTTICVFLPMVFTTGTVRELLVPMGLSITYCLAASLVVAMTVAPAASSTILRNARPKQHPWFDRVQDAYGRSLNWCLTHKAVPLAVSIALLAVCVWQVLRMGVVIIPEMTANQIQVSITTPEEMTRDDSYATADAAIDAILTVDGVDSVGVMDAGSTMGLVSSMSGAGSGSYGQYICYLTTAEDITDTRVQEICREVEAAAAGLDCTVTASAGGMADMSAMMSSGLSVNIYGKEMDTLVAISEDVMALAESVDGFENASNGLEEGDQTIHLVIDRDAAMRLGLTTAQIYQELAARISTSATAATITVNGVDMDVVVRNNTDPLLVENLMDTAFTTSTAGADGAAEEETHRLSEFATKEMADSVSAVNRENQNPYLTVTADTAEGQNTTLLAREMQDKLDEYIAAGNLPNGYTIQIAGESQQVNEMLVQMLELMAVALVFVYLVMVAQFQSLLSPFIVMFTIPLAFTGGMLGLLAAGQQLSLISLMGFLVLMGTVVNNGIVFVDYTNQLRLGGMERRPALIAAGKTRMRPIFMTALTTILAMAQLIFGDDMASQLGSGMAIVIAAGLAYATLMTLYIVPVMYDILFRKPPLDVDVGGDDLDDVPDDAAEFIQAALAHQAARQGEIDAENPKDSLPAT